MTLATRSLKIVTNAARSEFSSGQDPVASLAKIRVMVFRWLAVAPCAFVAAMTDEATIAVVDGNAPVRRIFPSRPVACRLHPGVTVLTAGASPAMAPVTPGSIRSGFCIVVPLESLGMAGGTHVRPQGLVTKRAVLTAVVAFETGFLGWDFQPRSILHLLQCLDIRIQVRVAYSAVIFMRIVGKDHVTPRIVRDEARRVLGSRQANQSRTPEQGHQKSQKNQ